MLSVVVPIYNEALHLPQSFNALLSQDYEDIEVIVVDDGSTDASIEVIEAFNDKRVKLVRRKENRGVVYSFNEGLHQASGGYVYGVSANDYILPGFFSTCMNLFKAFPEAGISLTNSMRYDPKTERYFSSYPMPFIKNPTFIQPHRLPKLYMKSFLTIGGSTAIFRTSLAKRERGLIENLFCLGDWYLATKIALTAGMIYIPEVLVCLRDHDDSFSKQILGNKEVRNFMYANLLEELSKCDKSVRSQFKQTGELGFVLKYAASEILKRPHFWQFCPMAIYRFLRRKFLSKKSMDQEVIRTRV